MDKYSMIRQRFEKAANSENALSMSAYMKNKFKFYGIASPERKALYKDFLKSEKALKSIDKAFLDKCFDDDYREFQYLVSDYLISMKKYVTFDDIENIRRYIITKSWWDTTDFLCKVVGEVGLRDVRVHDLMLEWSESDNIWLRRSAILHQLTYKDKTDTELLKTIIINNFSSDEFFINKAVGWALREYSKTSPEWVRGFLESYSEKMNSLSIKEASKYL